MGNFFLQPLFSENTAFFGSAAHDYAENAKFAAPYAEKRGEGANNASHKPAKARLPERLIERKRHGVG